MRNFEKKRKEVNTVIRKEKRIAEKKRLKDIKNLKHNSREFFKRCKTFKNRFVPAIRIIEDNNGTLSLQNRKILPRSLDRTLKKSSTETQQQE